MGKLVFVTNAPISPNGAQFPIGDVEYVANPTAPNGDAALCVDVTRISDLSKLYDRSQRVFVTWESPIFDPIYMDMRQIMAAPTWYDTVLSCNPLCLGWPNAKRATVGYRWATPCGPEEKKFGISMIVSGKSGLPAYDLRNKICAERGKITIPCAVKPPSNLCGILEKNWNEKAPNGEVKAGKDEYMNHMFHLCIENLPLCPGYFTEKILDCFFRFIVPVYFGDPSIGLLFDRRGIIMLDPNCWEQQINGLTVEDWSRRMPYMTENRKRAEPWQSFITSLDYWLRKYGLV